MRRVAGAAVVVWLTAAPAASAWSPDVAGATAYAKSRPGEVAFSVRWAGGVRGHQGWTSVPAASLMKTMLLAAYLRRADVRNRPLRRDERFMLAPMIRWSDNGTATRVRNIVGLAPLLGVARAAGMRDYTPYTVWGLSRTSARDQAALFWRLRSLFPRRHRAFALRLLRTVVEDQRWGIAEVAPRGWRLYFKGGWGRGTGAVDHQGALLVSGRRRVAIGITTTNSGTHAAGVATLRGVAARLVRGLDRPSIGSHSKLRS